MQPLVEQSEHARRLRDWENDASRLQRYLNECREHLDRHEHAAANRCWEKAAELSPRDAQVWQLRAELGQLVFGRQHELPGERPESPRRAL